MNLYEIWIMQYQIIHILISNGTSIEKKIDLQNEARRVAAILIISLYLLNIE